MAQPQCFLTCVQSRQYFFPSKKMLSFVGVHKKNKLFLGTCVCVSFSPQRECSHFLARSNNKIDLHTTVCCLLICKYLFVGCTTKWKLHTGKVTQSEDFETVSKLPFSYFRKTEMVSSFYLPNGNSWLSHNAFLFAFCRKNICSPQRECFLLLVCTKKTDSIFERLFA